MLTLTLGKKLKACRAALGMTQYDVSLACGIKEAVIKQIEDDADMTKAQWLISFIASRGLFLTETGITTIPQETPMSGTILTVDQVFQEFSIDPHFSDAWGAWDEQTRQQFTDTINVFGEQRFDMWFVDMEGQIRIGYKAPDMQRGSPFAFIHVKPEGFYLLWHHEADKALSGFSDGASPLSEGSVKMLRKHLLTHYDLIPTKIKALSGGRLPRNWQG